MDLKSMRTNTMFEARDAQSHNRDRPLPEWTIPPSRYRAKTLFLGKDHERWQQHERESMGTFGGSVHLAFKKGTSSLVNRSKLAAEDEGDEDEDDEDENEDEDYDEGSDGRRGSGSRWSEDDAWMSESASSAAPSTRRNSRRSSSNGSGLWRPRIKQQLQPGGHDAGATRRGSSSASSNRQGGDTATTTATTTAPRPRRFSSNGPEAAIMRHETVIGIHTPRRESSSSSASSIGGAPQQHFERLSLAPLSQISPASGPVSQVSPVGASSPAHTQSPSRTRKPKHRTSSSDLLAQAAAAAAASAQGGAADDDQDSMSVESMVQHAREKAQLRYEQLEGVEYDRSDDSSPSSHLGADGSRITGSQTASRSSSPRLALKLARRRKPIPVDGTLYDRTGPFREGAVTDGLSVRLFSAEDTGDGVAFADEDERRDFHHRHHPHKIPSSNLRRSSLVHEDAVADEDMVPTTYLITTPDNRVSSAAKLRRWAMDGDGRFYAAMEIKSIEAKMRNVDPTLGANPLSKSLLRELRDRYVDDILDEVQKAETLNPGRMAVAKVLKTSDGKYVRLEEDYPEEAFFVIAGCEERELYPVVALVFVNALRAIVGFHAAGWLHGDIKLENLMFDEQARLVVIDYENANPFRGIPGGDGRVTLASYDWIPPEAFAGPQGRRVGPSADLWALGCNVVRAFALRDDIEDNDIRETLLGKGQSGFLEFRRTKLLKRSSTGAIPASLPTPDDVDLAAILHDEEGEGLDSDDPRVKYLPPPPGPSPKRLLERFARDAPQLCKLVIARCISDRPEERGVEAEADCLAFATALERGQITCADLEEHEKLLEVGEKAVRTAIDLSGSAWVRPKLEDARLSLGL